MIAVMFEVQPAEGQREGYLAMAAALREELASVEGFISVERFQSLTEPGKMLSLSFWRDEAALADWRAREKHRTAQKAGRARMFAEYRLRVAAVIRDYGMTAREEAPADLRAVHG